MGQKIIAASQAFK